MYLLSNNRQKLAVARSVFPGIMPIIVPGSFNTVAGGVDAPKDAQIKETADKRYAYALREGLLALASTALVIETGVFSDEDHNIIGERTFVGLYNALQGSPFTYAFSEPFWFPKEFVAFLKNKWNGSDVLADFALQFIDLPDKSFLTVRNVPGYFSQGVLSRYDFIRDALKKLEYHQNLPITIGCDDTQVDVSPPRFSIKEVV